MFGAQTPGFVTAMLLGGFDAFALGLGLSCAAGLVLSATVHAQALPKGSYLDTCRGALADGGALVALCRNAAGVEHRAMLVNYPRCLGPISNNNGMLTCDFGLDDPAPRR